MHIFSRRRRRFRLRVIGASAIALGAIAASSIAPVPSASAAVLAPSVTSVPGATPFIARVTISNLPTRTLSEVSYTIVPKPGSTTRPISVSYLRSHLLAKGMIDPNTETITVPVFGLYASTAVHSNTVKLRLRFGRAMRSLVATIETTPWVDPSGGAFTSPVVLTPRNNDVRLDFSYFAIKPLVYPNPIVYDTDGEVRWVAPIGPVSPAWWPSSAFLANSFFVGTGTGIAKVELDGSTRSIADFAGVNVTSTNHHNFDPGKRGLLVEVDTTTNQESTILEVGLDGALLERFELSDIIEAAMIEGGDDPSGFVRRSVDWFHNNSATYWRAYDELVVSSRENFVIAIDYVTKKIKWILGDPTKLWYSYPSLRRYALAAPPGTRVPIGQHGLSIDNGRLLLFDNGWASLNQTPAGDQRTYSAPRLYRIDRRRRTATEVWSFERGQSIFANCCSSIYRSGRSYLIDYAAAPGGPRLVGLRLDGAVGFEYRIGSSPLQGWNALPVSLTGLVFSGSGA